MKLAKLFLGAGAVLAGSWLVARKRGSACPYSLRWALALPRPFIGPARLTDVLRSGPGERILEIGPGSGIYTPHVAQAVGPAGIVEIFDIQQEFLDHTMRVVAARGLDNVRPTRGDATMLPYDDESIDAVFLITVLGEIPDQEAALREITRVLRPGGRLVVGESFPDPEFVPFRSLRGKADAAGLHTEARHGPPLSYLAHLTKPARL